MATKAERVAAFNAAQRRRASLRLDAACEDVQDLWLNRFVWRTTIQAADGSPAVTRNPFFIYWVTSQYAQAACVAIRRLTECGPNASTTNSLVAVLEDVAANASAHPWQFIPADYRAADGSVDPARVQRDISELRDAAQMVSVYVNKHLAHLEQKANVTIPVVTDIDTAVDLLGELLQRYLLLLTGQDLSSVTPLLMFPWTAVFDEPWRPR